MLYYVYSHYMYQRTCDTIAPNALSQEARHWSEVILHIGYELINPTCGCKVFRYYINQLLVAS